jgi:glycosyltransferase involved in cell wall biosynthesis
MHSEGRWVSVVVPTFDGEALIERCLRSLLAQEGVALDVVVVDDGSRDRTAELASAYPVRVVVRSHEGVAAARNAGVHCARAPLVAFCDQDDEWRPSKAARQVAYLDDHPEAAAVLCRQEVVLAPGIEPPPWLVPDARGDLGGILPLSGLFRSEALAAVGGFDTALVGNDDLDLLVRLGEHGHRVDVLDEKLLVRHVHARNASHELGSYTPAIFDVLRRRVRRSRA